MRTSKIPLIFQWLSISPVALNLYVYLLRIGSKARKSLMFDAAMGYVLNENIIYLSSKKGSKRATKQVLVLSEMGGLGTIFHSLCQLFLISPVPLHLGHSLIPQSHPFLVLCIPSICPSPSQFVHSIGQPLKTIHIAHPTTTSHPPSIMYSAYLVRVSSIFIG